MVEDLILQIMLNLGLEPSFPMRGTGDVDPGQTEDERMLDFKDITEISKY